MRLWIAAGIAAVVCAEAPAQSYSPPRAFYGEPEFEALVARPFDETWTKVVEKAALNFLKVERTDKSAGLITLVFSDANAEEWIDCGEIDFWGPQSCQGSFAKCARELAGAQLRGEVTILMKTAESSQTRVQVRTRYAFNLPAGQGRNAMTWQFTTGKRASVRSSNPILGTDPERICQPTHRAEQAVLDALALD